MRWVWVIVVLLLSSCASTPSHFHTLMRSDPAPSSASTTDIQLTVEPVRVPAQVDRPELVTRMPDGGIAVADGERWVAPVADELQSALSVELLSRLSGLDVGHGKGPKTISVRLNVERFESIASRYALIEASWQLDLKEPGGDLHVACRTRAYEEVSGGYPELVRGYQRAVIVIADDIATATQNSTGGVAAGCPNG